MTHKKIYVTLLTLLFCNAAHSWPSRESAYNAFKSSIAYTGSLASSAASFVGLKAVYNYFNGPKKIDATLDSVHLLSFIPGQTPHSSQQKVDLKTLVQKMKAKKRDELNGAVIDTPQGNISLRAGLPENYKGTIYVHGAGLICCCDKYTYPERGASSAFQSFQKGIVDQGAYVTYAAPHHDRSTFNCGQEDDQKTISLVLNEVAAKNPQASIVMFGTCGGATGVVNTIASEKLHPETKAQIKALILQSPAQSADKVWKDMGNHHLPYGLKWLFPVLAPVWFPNCKSEKSAQDVDATYAKLPKHINVMVAKLAHDKVTPPQSVDEVTEKLMRNGNSVTTHECTDKKIDHAMMTRNAAYRAQVQGFLAQHKLDHATPATDVVIDMPDERPLGVSLWTL